MIMKERKIHDCNENWEKLSIRWKIFQYIEIYHCVRIIDLLTIV